MCPVGGRRVWRGVRGCGGLGDDWKGGAGCRGGCGRDLQLDFNQYQLPLTKCAECVLDRRVGCFGGLLGFGAKRCFWKISFILFKYIWDISSLC